MAKLKVNVKMNEKMILLMTKAQKQAAIMTMEAMKRDIEKAEIVPRDVGTLEESVTANTGLINKGTVRLECKCPGSMAGTLHRWGEEKLCQRYV